MARKGYPTDLTDAEWRVLEPLIPVAEPGGRPRRVDRREMVNAIRYLLRAGGAWRLLPHEFPPWQTVSASVRRWERDGPWARIAGTRRRSLRVARGRQPEPTAAIMASQTGKTTEQGGLGDTTGGSGSPDGNAIAWLTPRGC